MLDIRVIGGGSWGLALANLVADNGHSLTVWEYEKERADELIATHTNSVFLPGIKLNQAISFTNDLSDALKGEFDILLFAVPSQVLRIVAVQAWEYIQNKKDLKAIVNVAKGIEKKSLKRMSEVLSDTFYPQFKSLIMTLSGPSHAEEVAKKISTAVVIAGGTSSNQQLVQETFSNSYFRVYASDDIVGVELGGAVKNIISIAAGIADGLGLGDNTMGALLTRGIAEIKRLGVAMGAKPETFLGLSGIGDLITTAMSPHSRNRFVGTEIGKGRTLDEILSEMVMVAEGVDSTKSVYQLCKQYEVEMPITEQVYKMLFENKDPKEAIRSLMTRTLKQED
ncbi:MAG: NAD(P)H-dependent glycerol-3-phosphate dehydrogenase [Candidatus Zophobacter franzmannii]|jgi:glycerol-3-phosphate dehydrogenase (NAD(P)+)|nr:NAD(P)H-dependent glycerol-3-phosphate dehydrogenase [Candidatus Zophobacter franzmannii]